MSSEYFEICCKSHEFERSFDRSLKDISDSKSSPEGAFENLTDYEVVSSEEFDQDNDNGHTAEALKYCNVQPYFKNTRLFNNYESREKLNINLTAEKIALKSQTTKIDKSISQAETKKLREETSTATEQHRQQRQHVPIAFTIVPIKMATHKNGGDVINLPEIVLTSFETRQSAKAAASGIIGSKLPTAKKPATVTFRAAAEVTTTQQQLARAITKLPPPPSLPEVGRQKFAIANLTNKLSDTTEATVAAAQAEACNKFHDVAEDNSEISSPQPDSSTSPESLMENVLSAASSVSVRSSSLSSGGNEVAGETVSGVGFADDRNAVTASYPRVVLVPIRNAVTKETKTKQIQVSSALNSKSPTEIKSHTSLSLLPIQTKTTSSTVSSPTATAKATKATTAAATEIVSHLVQELQTLQPHPQPFDMGSNRSRSPSPSSIAIRVIPEQPTIFPEELKCRICAEVYRDPRTLNCLHSFCFQCIVVDENFRQDQSTSAQFWSQTDGGNAEEGDCKAINKTSSIRSSPETSLRSIMEPATSPSRQRRSSFSFRRKRSLERILIKAKPDGRSGTETSSPFRSMNFSDERARIISCKICNFSTELPIGGIRQLPQNFVLVRKIEELKLKADDEVISRVWCSLCFEETSATYHCISCMLNLCKLCKDAHERQRTTANHKIKNIMDLRRERKHQKNMLVDNTKFILKCGIHPDFEIRSFCSTCLQVACADCLVLLHKGHKHESISRAILMYTKIMRESAEQTRPLCNYGEHSIERLNDIAKSINSKCDDIQAEVETFIQQYFDAVEVHRKTLTQQVHRARESKVEMILEQQLDLEKRTQEAMEAIRFSQELTDIASDVEILSFVKILLKRFEFCQQFKTPADPKISDSLHFLPKIRAPSTKTQNDIPLFGIITMQTVEPSLCTLQWEGFSQLRLHKKAELVMLSRDADGVPLCHGGLQVNAQLKYKEYSSKFLPFEISDHRDGTYGIALTPDSQGTVILTVTVNDKPISGSPFTFLARSVRPHSGIYHCCAFCSSKGNKMVKCSCDGRMPGYNGCGHGHAGHPGRRHWSCCGNVLQNSECNTANKMLNT